jgi:hypothetical protein
MERIMVKGEEACSYTVEEFIKATRPDGFGHLYFNGEHICAYTDILCDACNKELVQPEDDPEKLVIHVWADRAWCQECFERWVADSDW